MFLTPLQKYSKKEQNKFIRQLAGPQTITRIKFLFSLPMNSRVTEIGVAGGNFSECILKVNQPIVLHLIDCWQYQKDSNYSQDSSNLPQKQQDRLYKSVKKRFSNFPKVKIHRQYSLSAVKKFPSGYFDWIYLDANHDYSAVKADLNAWYPKVKFEGIIAGDDYTSKSGFGVVAAVDEFAKKNGLTMFLLDYDPWHSWALAKPETVQKLIRHNQVNNLILNIARSFIRNSSLDYIYTMIVLRLRRMTFLGKKWIYC